AKKMPFASPTAPSAAAPSRPTTAVSTKPIRASPAWAAATGTASRSSSRSSPRRRGASASLVAGTRTAPGAYLRPTRESNPQRRLERPQIGSGGRIRIPRGEVHGRPAPDAEVHPGQGEGLRRALPGNPVTAPFFVQTLL